MKNPYPVILSLEVHASGEQQQKMAEIMARVFGDKLPSQVGANLLWLLVYFVTSREAL